MKLLLAVLAGALAVALVPLGVAAASYRDPSGDSGTAPDITAVTVSTTEAGVVVRITAALKLWTTVALLIDTDRNPSTGAEWGFDRVVLTGLDSSIERDLEVLVLNETGQVLPGVSLAATFVAGVVEFSLPYREFPVDKGFRFRVETYCNKDDTDVAPDKGVWSYGLAGQAPPVTPLIGKAVATPRQPIAGKRFAVRVPVTRSDDGWPLTKAAVACTAKVGGKAVPHRHTFRNGTLRATLTIPKAAKGKRLKIAVRVTANRKTAAKAFTFRIR